eukprot:64010_1
MFLITFYLIFNAIFADERLMDEVCADYNIVNGMNVAMNAEFTAYDVSAFNNCSWINDVIQQPISELVEFDKMIELLGTLIVKHGLQSVIGLTNIHKHFDLKLNERMVFEINSDFGDTDIIFMGKPITNKTTDCRQMPYMFKMMDDNAEYNTFKWMPLQFICTHNVDLIHELDLFMKSDLFTLFLAEISYLLTNSNHNHKIGIYWRIHEYFTFQKPFENLVEHTFVDRTQIFKIYERDNNLTQKMFPTRYIFPTDIGENWMDFTAMFMQLDKCRSLAPTNCIEICETHYNADGKSYHVQRHRYTRYNFVTI